MHRISGDVVVKSAFGYILYLECQRSINFCKLCWDVGMQHSNNTSVLGFANILSFLYRRMSLMHGIGISRV